MVNIGIILYTVSCPDTTSMKMRGSNEHRVFKKPADAAVLHWATRLAETRRQHELRRAERIEYIRCNVLDRIMGCESVGIRRAIRPDDSKNRRRTLPVLTHVCELVVAGPPHAVLTFFMAGCGDKTPHTTPSPTSFVDFSLEPFQGVSVERGSDDLITSLNPFLFPSSDALPAIVSLVKCDTDIKWDMHGIEGSFRPHSVSDVQAKNDMIHVVLSALGPSAGCAWCTESSFCSNDHLDKVRILSTIDHPFMQQHKKTSTVLFF
jgi:hypothetical protein